MPVGFLAVVVIVAALAGVGRWIELRPSAAPPSASKRAVAPSPPPAAAVVPTAPATGSLRRPGPLTALPDVEAKTTAASLLASAAAARQQGDLRATLSLLQAAVERASAVETHAALGAFYLELGVARAAETNLRAAVEGDPGNADRWLALANALALKPDPIAAADALEHASAAEPGLRVIRGPGGWLAREPALPAP